MTTAPVRAPRTPIDLAGPATEAERGSVMFIGTATTLLRLGPFTLLTDPNFLHQGDHAPLGGGLRSRRLTEPACQIADLPALDGVVLSHHHGDHFDHIAAEELDAGLPIVTTPHAARKLIHQGFHRPIALRTWEAQRLTRAGESLTITSMPGQHAPRPLQRVMPDVMGSLLDVDGADGARRARIYITGDTLLHDALAEIPRRYPAIDVCLIHLGGTRILGILLTMDAEQGVRALQLVAPRHTIPVHYDDYTVFKSSLDDFRQAASRSHVESELHYLDRGDSWSFAFSELRD